MIDLNSLTLETPLTEEQVLEIFSAALSRVEKLEKDVTNLESRFA